MTGSRVPEVLQNVKDTTELSEPNKYRVLLHNDDYTTMEFVVQVLETVFNRTSSESIQIMLNVHRTGSGLCGIYPLEIAETKVDMVHYMADRNKFPLKCTMEEL
jgi:ATP-dependent Clp protease adaptor protein ClpS